MFIFEAAALKNATEVTVFGRIYHLIKFDPN